MGAVFDHFDPVLFRNFNDPFDIGERTEKVNRDHRFGFWRDCRFEGVRIHAEGIGFAVHENRGRAHIDRSHAGRHPGPARHDDFIAGADPQRYHRRFQRDRAVHHERAVSGVMIFGEIGRKFLFLGAVETPVVPHVDFLQPFRGFRPHRRPGFESEVFREDPGSTVDRQFAHNISLLISGILQGSVFMCLPMNISAFLPEINISLLKKIYRS